jgi:hypothetical protein
MRKTIGLILACIFVLSGVHFAFASESESVATTYTFKGGDWKNPTSWEPPTQDNNGPAKDSNIIISKGLTAKAPADLDITTITVAGKLILEQSFTANSMTVEIGGECVLPKKGKITGLLKNAGTITTSGSTLMIMNFENPGQIISTGTITFTAMFMASNSGTITSTGHIMFWFGDFINTGKILTTTNSIIAIYAIKKFNNIGRVSTGNGKESDGIGSDGGNIYIAVSEFEGTGSIEPGDGADATITPGKAGVAVIGANFDTEAWGNGTPTPPTGSPPANLEPWKAQIQNGRDGRKILLGGTLYFEKIASSQPGPFGAPSVVCQTAGGSIALTLRWEGTGVLMVKGTTNKDWAKLSMPIDYIPAKGKLNLTLRLNDRPQGNDRIVVTYTSPGTPYLARVTLDVFFAKCPIIECFVGSKEAKVTNDNNVTVKKTMSVAPFITGKTTMVPLRFFVENCGGEVVWDYVSKTAKVSMPGRECVFALGNTKASVNNNSIDLATSTKIVGGRLMAPVDSLAQMVGARVSVTKGKITFVYP